MAEDKKIAALLEKYEKGALAPKAMAPMDYFVYCIFMDTAQCPPAEAAEAVKRLRAAFVDFNDIRVARWVEVADRLAPLPNADPAARRLRDMLNRVFDTCGVMSLDFLAGMKVNEARKALAALDPALPKEMPQLILYALVPGQSLIISDEALAVARQQGAIAKNGNRQNLQKALADSGLAIEKCAALVHYWEIESDSKKKKPAPKKDEKPAAKKKK